MFTNLSYNNDITTGGAPQILSKLTASVPFVGGILGSAIEAYNFKKRWESMIGTIRLFEGTVFNIMQPDGLYTKVLLSTKMAGMEDIPSHIYSTGHFFSIVTRMLQLCANWNRNMKTLKESKHWDDMRVLVQDMKGVRPKGTYSEEEMKYMQNEIKGIFNNSEGIALATNQYVNTLIINAYLKDSDNIVKGFPTKSNQFLMIKKGGRGVSLKQFLIHTIKSTNSLKEKYGIRPTDDQLLDYCRERIIHSFNECLEKSKNGNSMSSGLGLDIPNTLDGKETFGVSKSTLRVKLIETHLRELTKQLQKERQHITDVPKGNVEIAMQPPSKKKGKRRKFRFSAKAIRSSSSKIRKDAGNHMNHATKFVQKKIPKRLQQNMRQTYLATFLDMYEGPCKGIFKVYSFTTSTLTLEVGYESWQSEIENTTGKDTKYKHWLEQTRTLVKNISTCIQQDDEEDNQDPIRQQIKERGFSCTLMDIIEDNLKSLKLSPSFTNILKGHLKELSHHRISKEGNPSLLDSKSDSESGSESDSDSDSDSESESDSDSVSESESDSETKSKSQEGGDSVSLSDCLACSDVASMSSYTNSAYLFNN